MDGNGGREEEKEDENRLMTLEPWPRLSGGHDVEIAV